MKTPEHLFFQGCDPVPALRSRVASNTEAPRTQPHAPAEDAVQFLSWLLGCAGLSLDFYRTHCLARRLPACLRQLRVDSLREARCAIEADPALVGRMVDVVLLGVTRFFRDATTFALLRRQILPALLARKRPLRIWSAGCSGGHELYSVAMLLEELGGLSRCELLGTDCRPAAIERAMDAVYPLTSLGEVPLGFGPRFFQTEGTCVRVSESLRSAARWEVSDLLAGAAPGPWDLILWRNMAIYLTADAAHLVWTRLCEQTRVGGFLVAGRADYPPRELGWVRVRGDVFFMDREES